MVLAVLLPCNITRADDVLPFLPVFTPEEQAELARGSTTSPPPTPPHVVKELEEAVAATRAIAGNTVRDAELGQQLTTLICDPVKTDTAHKTPGYRLVEDLARPCVDDVNLSRNLGVPPPDAFEGKNASGDQRAYLACMARACEDRVLMKLMAK